MITPAPRPLTVPEQRALEALASQASGRPIITPQTGYMPALDELERRGMAAHHATRGSRCWQVTDRGRAYLRTLGVTA